MDMGRPTIYLDIETTGTDSDAVLRHALAGVKPRANLKDPAKIEADLEDKRRNLWSSTALHPYQGRLACIGFAAGTASPCVLTDDDESIMLQMFFAEVKRYIREHRHRTPRYVGFNIKFDLHWIWSRALVHGIKPSFPLHHTAKPWDTDHVIDLRWTLGGGDIHATGTLKDWSVALDLEVDDGDIDGADVPGLWTEGARELVMEHCMFDVERVRLIHKRIEAVS